MREQCTDMLVISSSLTTDPLDLSIHLLDLVIEVDYASDA